jgi:hypothetical protein
MSVWIPALLAGMTESSKATETYFEQQRTKQILVSLHAGGCARFLAQ